MELGNNNDQEFQPNFEQVEENNFPVPEESHEEDNKQEDIEKISRNYTAWVTASAFAAISTLFSILYFVQNKQYDISRGDLKHEKEEHKRDRRSDSTTIANLRVQLDNCDDASIDDMLNKVEKLQRLRSAIKYDVNSLTKDIEETKNSTNSIMKETQKIKRQINQ